MPTQVQHSWRAVARTALAVLMALASLTPEILSTAGLNQTVAGVQVLGVTAAVTRVLAMPGINAFLTSWLPFLAAAPAQPNGKCLPGGSN